VIGLTDSELIVRAREGSPMALAEILRRHQPAVRGFLRRVGGGAGEADDLAQETFLAAFARLDEFRGEASLRSWLCGIAWRKVQAGRRGGARRSAREAASARPDAATTPSPEQRLDIEAAFARLTVEQRAAAALCLASDLSHGEAAAALGIPLGTLKSRVAGARRILIEALEDYR
jgi:RNA polymerase sigma-70 factor (ECF subfamily)